MKAVLMSIKPRYCELIASGKKTVEVRKTKPKIAPPFKVYIYETKDKRYENIGVCGWKEDGTNYIFKNHCGKVIGEFVCDRIVQFENSIYDEALRETVTRSCVPMYDLLVYLGKQDYGYGWHISNLVIYDKPRELGEFLVYCENCRKKFVGFPNCWKGCFVRGSEKPPRPPQSWCYVEEDNDGA